MKSCQKISHYNIINQFGFILSALTIHTSQSVSDFFLIHIKLTIKNNANIPTFRQLWSKTPLAPSIIKKPTYYPGPYKGPKIFYCFQILYNTWNENIFGSKLHFPRMFFPHFFFSTLKLLHEDIDFIDYYDQELTINFMVLKSKIFLPVRAIRGHATFSIVSQFLFNH